MEMTKAIGFVVVLLLISPAAYAATRHTVGGGSGWTTGINYDPWASGQTFNTGDTLLFNYGSSHDFAEVSQTDYENCNTENPISSHSSSPTTITLSTPGTRYFICSQSDHCSEGMRLAVTTTSSDSSGTSTTTPSYGGATGGFNYAGNNLILVGISSLFFAVVVGLMDY